MSKLNDYIERQQQNKDYRGYSERHGDMMPPKVDDIIKKKLAEIKKLDMGNAEDKKKMLELQQDVTNLQSGKLKK